MLLGSRSQPLDSTDQKAPAPLVVPKPVGPSQPTPAVHRSVPQDPLLPEVTSKKSLDGAPKSPEPAVERPR